MSLGEPCWDCDHDAAQHWDSENMWSAPCSVCECVEFQPALWPEEEGGEG